MENSENKHNNEETNATLASETKNLNTSTALPKDLIDDLKKNKIDPLTEGSTHLGYDERAPRKKELEQKEHYDQDDK